MEVNAHAANAAPAAVERAGWASGYTLEVLDHYEGWPEFGGGAHAAPGNRVGALKLVDRATWAAQPRADHHPGNTDWFRCELLERYFVGSRSRDGRAVYDGSRVNAREGGRATDCERTTFDGRPHLGVEASLGCVEWCGESGCVVYRGQGHMNQRPGLVRAEAADGTAFCRLSEEYYSTYKVLPDWTVRGEDLTGHQVEGALETSLCVYRADARPLAQARRQAVDGVAVELGVGSYRTIRDARDADVLQMFFDSVANSALAPVAARCALTGATKVVELLPGGDVQLRKQEERAHGRTVFRGVVRIDERAHGRTAQAAAARASVAARLATATAALKVTIRQGVVAACRAGGPAGNAVPDGVREQVASYLNGAKPELEAATGHWIQHQLAAAGESVEESGAFPFRELTPEELLAENRTDEIQGDAEGDDTDMFTRACGAAAGCNSDAACDGAANAPSSYTTVSEATIDEEEENHLNASDEQGLCAESQLAEESAATHWGTSETSEEQQPLLDENDASQGHMPAAAQYANHADMQAANTYNYNYGAAHGQDAFANSSQSQCSGAGAGFGNYYVPQHGRGADKNKPNPMSSGSKWCWVVVALLALVFLLVCGLVGNHIWTIKARERAEREKREREEKAEANMRSLASRLNIQKMRRDKSATVLQKLVRGQAGRRDAEAERESHRAATAVQKVARGTAGRRVAERLAAERAEAEARRAAERAEAARQEELRRIRERAATAMQKVARGAAGRAVAETVKRDKKENNAASRLQQHVKEKQRARKAEEEARLAAERAEAEARLAAERAEAEARLAAERAEAARQEALRQEAERAAEAERARQQESALTQMYQWVRAPFQLADKPKVELTFPALATGEHRPKFTVFAPTAWADVEHMFRGRRAAAEDEQKPALMEGELVRVRANVTNPDYGWGDRESVQGQVGRIVDIYKFAGFANVVFPKLTTGWKGKFHELKRVAVAPGSDRTSPFLNPLVRWEKGDSVGRNLLAPETRRKQLPLHESLRRRFRGGQSDAQEFLSGASGIVRRVNFEGDDNVPLYPDEAREEMASAEDALKQGRVSDEVAVQRRNELLDWMFSLHQHGADIYGEEITCLNDLLTRSAGVKTSAYPGGESYYKDDLATVGHCASNPYRVLNFENMSRKRLFGYTALQRIVYTAMTAGPRNVGTSTYAHPGGLAPTERALWLAAYYVNHGHPFSGGQHAALPVGATVGDTMWIKFHEGYFPGTVAHFMGGDCRPIDNEIVGPWTGSSAPIVRAGDEEEFQRKELYTDELYTRKRMMHYNDPNMVPTYKSFGTRYFRYKATLDDDGNVAPVVERVLNEETDEITADDLEKEKQRFTKPTVDEIQNRRYQKLTCQQDEEGRQALYKPGAWPQEVIERGHAFALHQDDARPEVKVPHMILYTCAGSTFMNTVHELYAKYKYGDILRSRDVIFTHSDPFWLYVEPRAPPPARKYRMEGNTLIFIPLERTVQTRTPFYPYFEYRTIRRPDSRQGVIDEFARMIRMSDGAELYGAVVNEGFFGPSNSQYYSGYFDRGVSPLVQRLGELGNYVFWAKGPAKGPGAYSDSPITRINGASKQPLDETDNVAGKDQMCRNRLEIWVPVNRVSVARFFKYSTSLFNPYARATDGEGAANADRKLNPELHHTYVLMPGKFKFIKYEHADFLGARRHNTVVQLLEDDEEVAAALS